MTKDNPDISNSLKAIESINIKTVRIIRDVMDVTPENVPEIHASVKEEFEKRISSISESINFRSQLFLPVIGTAGSGKTHLLTDLYLTTEKYNGIFIPIDISRTNNFYSIANSHILDALEKKLKYNRTQLSRALSNLLNHLKFTQIPDDIEDRLRSLNVDKLLKIVYEVLKKMESVCVLEHFQYGDVVRALFLLTSENRRVSTIGFNIITNIKLDDEEMKEFGILREETEPEIVFKGLTWLFSLNGSFTVFGIDQFDSLIKAEFQPQVTDKNNILPAVVKSHNLVTLFLNALKNIHAYSPRVFCVLTIFNDTWVKLNSSQYYRSILSKIFDTPLPLEPVKSVSQAKNLIFKILNHAYQKYSVIPPYKTWPFPESFFESKEGIFPREILKRAAEHILECKLRREVSEWPFRKKQPQGEFDEMEILYNDLLKSQDLSRIKDKDAEISFWRPALIAFAECFAAENSGAADGFSVAPEYQDQVNSKRPTADVKIVLYHDGVVVHTLSIWAILQTQWKAVVSRVKGAVDGSGINKRYPNRKLAVIHFESLSKNPSTLKEWDKFVKNGGIDVIPDDTSLSLFYALKSVREKYPDLFSKWAGRGKRSLENASLRECLEEILRLLG
ncbi:MAG: ATP-binding protein [Deltaproteobacteria bacterium]|jgi:hypothetical protein|nr:ATP-binding protein [Deltaproteobacteria bacterium]